MSIPYSDLSRYPLSAVTQETAPRHYAASRRRKHPFKRWVGILFRLSLILVPIIALSIWAFSLVSGWFGLDVLLLPTTRPPEILFDPGGRLVKPEKKQLTQRLIQLNRMFQTDWMVLVLPKSKPEELRPLAQSLFTKWQIGQSGFAKRGALMVLSEDPKRVSMILSPELERAWTKAPAVSSNIHFTDYLEAQPVEEMAQSHSLSERLWYLFDTVEHEYHPTLASTSPTLQPLPASEIVSKIAEEPLFSIGTLDASKASASVVMTPAE